MVVSNIFYFHPYFSGRFPFWRAYFSKGLKPPTRNPSLFWSDKKLSKRCMPSKIKSWNKHLEFFEGFMGEPTSRWMVFRNPARKPPGMYKTLVNHGYGINYQPQLVSWISALDSISLIHLTVIEILLSFLKVLAPTDAQNIRKYTNNSQPRCSQ